LFLLVAGSLISGLLSGFYRLGLSLPEAQVYLHHGAIMTGSFLGTVILIERITTMKIKWLYLFPIINVSSILLFWMDLFTLGYIALLIGSLGLAVVFYIIIIKHADLPHRLMLVGAIAWLIGNLFLLLQSGYQSAILWWMAFLLITIVGERLELIRFLPISKAKRYVLIGFLLFFLIGCWLPFHLGGKNLMGIMMLLVMIWLFLYDMVRKSIKHPGIHRYTAISLIGGYIWLGITGLLFIADGSFTVPYDALVHTFFLGFVFSMIFAHAPIILPGILGLSYKFYHPSLYLWAALLNASLVLRLGSALLILPEWKQWSGLANGVFILLFLINILIIRIALKRVYK
jgi:hypothetical protein